MPDRQSANMDIWIMDLARNVPTRFTFDPAAEGFPIWSPDGRQIPPFSFTFGRLTHFAVDIGGIFEYNVTRRISFRTDLGDTIVRHGSQTSTSIIGNTLTTPSYYRNNLQWSSGIIFRF
jgi:Tol biopolymer transport system component